MYARLRFSKHIMDNGSRHIPILVIILTEIKLRTEYYIHSVTGLRKEFEPRGHEYT